MPIYKREGFSVPTRGQKCESRGTKRGDSWKKVGAFWEAFMGWKHMENT